MREQCEPTAALHRWPVFPATWEAGRIVAASLQMRKMGRRGCPWTQVTQLTCKGSRIQTPFSRLQSSVVHGLQCAWGLGFNEREPACAGMWV